MRCSWHGKRGQGDSVHQLGTAIFTPLGGAMVASTPPPHRRTWVCSGLKRCQNTLDCNYCTAMCRRVHTARVGTRCQSHSGRLSQRHNKVMKPSAPQSFLAAHSKGSSYRLGNSSPSWPGTQRTSPHQTARTAQLDRHLLQSITNWRRNSSQAGMPQSIPSTALVTGAEPIWRTQHDNRGHGSTGERTIRQPRTPRSRTVLRY